MRKVRVAAVAALGFGVLVGCSTFRDQSKAMVGGGAVAGQDYINGLAPSEKARTYFAQNASDESKAVAISRTGDGANNTSVRFVANGGVVIPPGASITFENQGYCCDPHLPAPKAGDEFQFVKTTQLIPEELQSIYRKLLIKASNGDEATLKNMQKLVWALRTAGTEAGYANNLTDEQKKILNSCSEYEGEFELYCSEKLALSRFWKKLLSKADSYTTINIGGVTYQASDLLDDKVGEKKIKEHLGQLITLGESMPVEHNGFNYGELASGIYTDIKGTGPLKFKATVANSTSQNFTFYPMDYIAQVGSGVSDESASVVYFATASSTQKQRVTIIPQDKMRVDQRSVEQPVVSNTTDMWSNLTSAEKQRILDFAIMSQVAYDGDQMWSVGDYSQVSLAMLDHNLGSDVASLLQKIKNVEGTDRGLDISVFKDRTGQYTVVFRGTEPSDPSDLKADLALWSGRRSVQSVAVASIVSQIADGSGKPVNLAGHSLGGYLATVAGLENSGKVANVYTFNSPGLDITALNAYDNATKQAISAKTINSWHVNDLVHLVNESWTGASSASDGSQHLGRNVEMTEYAGFSDRVCSVITAPVPGRPYEHSIDTFVDRALANMD